MSLEGGDGATSRDSYGDLVPRKHVTVVLTKKKSKEKLGIKLGGGIDSGDVTKLDLNRASVCCNILTYM